MDTTNETHNSSENGLKYFNFDRKYLEHEGLSKAQIDQLYTKLFTYSSSISSMF